MNTNTVFQCSCCNSKNLVFDGNYKAVTGDRIVRIYCDDCKQADYIKANTSPKYQPKN